MRTFFDIDLLSKIRKDPFSYIGQREFRLLQNFLMPIQSSTEPKISENVIGIATCYPSIREYIVNKYDFFDPTDSAQWTWAIKFDVENQQELLDKYFETLFEYEKKIPMKKDSYSIECKAKYVLDVTKTIRLLCARPQMMGIGNLAGVRAYIDGHYWLKSKYRLPLTENEIRLEKFIEFWKNKTDPKIKFDTWERPLMKERMNVSAFSFADETNGGWVLDRFVEIMEEDGIELAQIKKIE